jgi:hypothetical protein
MKINYTLRRSRKRRKTISLNISEANEIIVSAPYFVPVREINNFVQEKREWIDKTIKKQAHDRCVHKEKEYVSGEHFYYLGKSYPVEGFFEPTEKQGILFRNQKFYLNAPENKEIRKNCFILWYKQKALKHICGRVDFFCRQLNLRASGARISSARKRWGSCSPGNKLAFSFRLIMMPPEIIDYVIVHELMHIKEKNHSQRFWKLVEAAMPQYKTCQFNLKNYSENILF